MGIVDGWHRRRNERRARARAELARHTQDALDVVRDVAREALERDAAVLETVSRDFPAGRSESYVLRPRNRGACPVEIEVGEHQINVYLGEEGHLHELWQKDTGERLTELRRCIAAVVGGRYEETIEAGGEKFVGTFHTPEGAETFTHGGAIGYGTPGRRTYRPYLADESARRGS